MEQPKLNPEYQLHKRLHKLMRDAIKEFSLIEKGDRILLGLSGGKDSLTLLDLLGENMAHSNHYYSIEAIHVKVKQVDYQSDISYLQQRAARWDIPFHLVEIDVDPDRNKKRTPCFLCSWNRRKTFFETAQRLNCNKIALGHHQDDILRTALMNLTFNGDFTTMPARITMNKFPLTIIRPLAKIKEMDIQTWSKLQQFEPVKRICPYDTQSVRTHIEQVTDAMEKLNPNYRTNLWHALLKANALVE